MVEEIDQDIKVLKKTENPFTIRKKLIEMTFLHQRLTVLDLQFYFYGV